MVPLLLIAGAAPDARARDGKTPLHYAAEHNAPASAFENLVQAGADPDARDRDGATPLHRAAAFGKSSAALVALLQAGADPGARTADGKLPLDLVRHNAALRDTEARRRLEAAQRR